MLQIVMFSLNYESCRDKKSIKKITHRKRNIFWHPKWFWCLMFGIICMFPRQLPKIPPVVQQNQAVRAHQSPTGYTPSHPAGKGHHPHTPGYVGWHRLSPTQACSPAGKGKKKYPTNLRKLAQHLKGSSVVSSPHSLFKGVFWPRW